MSIVKGGRSSKEWSTGFCNMIASPAGPIGCCYVLYCMPCAWADIEAGMVAIPEKRSSHWWNFLGSVIFWSIVPCGCCKTTSMLLQTRAELEGAYGIADDDAGCCTALLFAPCILTQMQNELAIRKQAGGVVPMPNPASLCTVASPNNATGIPKPMAMGAASPYAPAGAAGVAKY